MKKQIVRETIFFKEYKGIITGFPFSDLPKDILPTDIIDLRKDEGFYSENNSWDAHSSLSVYREREETEDEFEKRKESWNERLEETKAERFKLYEKLKKEFESGNK